MPRVSYTQTFKTAGEVEKFPELKLRTAEKSRCWLPDEPWMEWYHRIEAPLIIDGEVQMEVKDTKRGPVEVQKMDWIGSAFCVGVTGTPDSPGPLMLEGIDPANCPVCESAANSTGVKAPEQRFAAPVIKYKIRGRGENPYALITPTSAEVLVWAYTGRIHGMLHDLAAREGADLRKLDITIDLEDGPGADTYQKIKSLAAIRETAWRDPAVKEYIRQLWADPENRPTDEQLRVACKGRDYARPVLLDMVRRAERQWRDSERAGGSGGDLGAADAGFNGGLSEGIDALLETGPADADPSADAGRSDTSAQVSGDPFADHPGGTEEFATADQRAAIAEAKAQAQADIQQIVSPDPFAETGEPATGATTTSTAAPAAGSRSGTAPKPAQTATGSDAAREQAVSQAADGMFGEPSGDSAPPEPARGNGRRHTAKAEPAAAPDPAPEPEPVGARAGGEIIDFDDLFKD